MKNFKIQNKIYWALLLSSIYLTQNWINFFYLAPDNPDFDKYYDYLNYFLGLNVKIDYGQGSLYYYIISIIYLRKIELIDTNNIDILLSYSVQQVNFVIYLFGILGIYKLLKIKKIKLDTVLLTLSILNFFPLSIFMRSVMKPEILAFALIFWILYFLEKYLLTDSSKYLWFLIPFITLIINTKASIAGMTIVYLLIFYREILKKIKIREFGLLLSLFLSCLFIIQYENYRITNLTPFEREYDIEYDNKAKASTIYRFSISDLFKDPFLKYDYQEDFYSIHANSVINITLLDTFGDHFEQLFELSPSYFSKFRKKIFINDSEMFITSNRQIEYSGPFKELLINNLNKLRKITSVILTIFFYMGIFYYSYKNKESRKFYFAPFVGIIILYANSLGFPSNNFNPYKGDTYKSFYYVFLLTIAFTFISVEVFRKINIFKLTLFFVFIFSVFFVSGHPKSNSQNLSEHLVVMNEFSNFCEVNNILFFENDLIKYFHKSGNINNYNSDCKNYSTYRYLQSINKPIQKDYSKDCLDKNNKLNILLSNTDKCRIYAIKLITSKQTSKNGSPYFSLFLTSISFLIVFKDRNKMLKEK